MKRILFRPLSLRLVLALLIQLLPGAVFAQNESMTEEDNAALLKSNTISNAGVSVLKTLAQKAAGKSVHPQVLKVANEAVRTMGRYIAKSGFSEFLGSAASTAVQAASAKVFEKAFDYYWRQAA